MGYYTDFELDFITCGNLDKEIISYLDTISGYDLSQHELYQVKWYNWHTDMISLSKTYPDILFTLVGVGEEKGDQWKAYFKNGKAQICKAKITFDKYDESKME